VPNVSFHLDFNKKKAQISNVSAEFWVALCVCTLKVTEDSDSAKMLPRDYLNIHTEAYSYAAQIPPCKR